MKEKEHLGLLDSLRVLFGASRAFWLVNLVNFVDGIAYFGILTLLTRYLGADLHFSDESAGLAVSWFTGLVTITMLAGGFVSDRIGVRRALTLSLVLLLAGRAMLSGAGHLGGQPTAWFALVLMAVGSGVIQPALYAGVKDYTDARTATIGYSLLYSIMNLGIVAENFLSPYLRTSDPFLNLGGRVIHGLGLGISGVFWTCTALTGVVLLIHLVLFTAALQPLPPVEEERPDGEAPAAVRSPFLDPRFMFFIFILLPVRTLFAHQWLTIPDYVFRCFPEAVNSKFEWISGLNPLIIVFFVPTIASLTRKAKVLDMMLIGTTLSAVTTFILVPSPELGRLLTYVALFSLGEAVWSSRFLEYVADLAPPGKVGSYMGLANIPWFLAKFTTGLYSGMMLNRFIPATGPRDPGTLWIIYGCIACITPVGLLLARRWLRQGEH